MAIKCKTCGSEKLSWAPHMYTTSGVPDGRLRQNEVQCQFVLGCDECSDTITTMNADVVAMVLTVKQNQPKLVRSLVEIIDRELMPHIARLPVQRLDTLNETLIAARKLLEGAE